MTNDVIEYQASVFIQRGGWRSVEITARVKPISEKMVEVVEVIAIDGEAPEGYTSRTGAKGQTYNAGGVAQREIGKKKRLSACKIMA